MKEYQMRTADLSRIILRFNCETEAQAKTAYESEVENREQEKLVLSEWETEAEADKARLDWLQHHYSIQDGKGVKSLVCVETGEELHLFDNFRSVVDRARNAPQPKVTVIE